MSGTTRVARPRGAAAIAIVNGTAAVLHILFWSLAFLRLSSPPTGAISPPAEALPFTYGFGIADLLWSVPFLVVSAIGLWRMRDWGWFAAQLAHALYFYSLTVIVVRDLLSRAISPGTVVFLPFGMFAMWASVYLWRTRKLFWSNVSNSPCVER